VPKLLQMGKLQIGFQFPTPDNTFDKSELSRTDKVTWEGVDLSRTLHCIYLMTKKSDPLSQFDTVLYRWVQRLTNNTTPVGTKRYVEKSCSCQWSSLLICYAEQKSIHFFQKKNVQIIEISCNYTNDFFSF
jgi:hypothetical protein